MVGNKSRDRGSEWESYVRKSLIEKDNFFITKFHNNFDLKKKKIVSARPGFYRLMQTGFPDFMIWKNKSEKLYGVYGVECKVGGELSKIEKMKCYHYLKQNVFIDIYIAHKTKVNNRIVIIYDNFRDRHRAWITNYEKNKKK